MTTVLIADGEPDAVSQLELALWASGYSTVAARTGAQVLALALGDTLDLLIIADELPDMGTEGVLRGIRAAGTTLPVVVLGSTGVAHAATFLDCGADDYMTKPARFDELVARIRARLRPASPAVDTLTAGPLRLDLLSRRCTIGAREVALTTREFAVAEVLLRHPRQALTRYQIASRVWGSDVDPASNVVDAHIGNLRRKLGGSLIHTVRGIGYRLDG